MHDKVQAVERVLIVLTNQFNVALWSHYDILCTYISAGGNTMINKRYNHEISSHLIMEFSFALLHLYAGLKTGPHIFDKS